ncbi:MAG: hypothetical protein ACLQAT_03520 [Candidatus Binataceae bacterium]
MLTLAANVEYGNPITPPQDCPPNLVDYPFITGPQGSLVVVSFNNGDQLFLAIGNTSYECDSPNLPYPGYDVASGTITGGEGTYANATGTWSIRSHGGILRIDAAGHLFGNDTGKLVVFLVRCEPKV